MQIRLAVCVNVEHFVNFHFNHLFLSKIRSYIPGLLSGGLHGASKEPVKPALFFPSIQAFTEKYNKLIAVPFLLRPARYWSDPGQK